MRVSTVSTSATFSALPVEGVTADSAGALLTVRAIADRTFQQADHDYQNGQFTPARRKFATALNQYTQAQVTSGIGRSLSGLSAVALKLENWEGALT